MSEKCEESLGPPPNEMNFTLPPANSEKFPPPPNLSDIKLLPYHRSPSVTPTQDIENLSPPPSTNSNQTSELGVWKPTWRLTDDMKLTNKKTQPGNLWIRNVSPPSQIPYLAPSPQSASITKCKLMHYFNALYCN